METDQTLGKHRGVRDQVSIICKGAHTPFCFPKDLTRQIGESFERLMKSRK